MYSFMGLSCKTFELCWFKGKLVVTCKSGFLPFELHATVSVCLALRSTSPAANTQDKAQWPISNVPNVASDTE